MTEPKQTAPPRKPCKTPAKGKSGIIMPERLHADLEMTYCPYGGLEKIMRAQRVNQAYHFKKMYRFQNDFPESKTCILPCDSSNWNENSFGLTYVAVRGKHITCVAFKKTMEPIRDRLGGYLAYNHENITFNMLGSTIVSEIEVGEDNPRGPSTRIPCSSCGGGHVHKRFAIVSVVPNAENVDKVAAVHYLEGIMARDEDLYPRETEKTVVAALQILLNEEFKPEDIWVHTSSLDEEEGCINIDQIKYRLNMIKMNED